MENKITIVKYGTKVLMCRGEIKGLITAVAIRDQWIQYEVSYFSGGNHKSIWVQRIEFEIDESQKKSPGLVNYHTQPDSGTLLIE